MTTKLVNQKTKANIYSIVNEYDYLPTSLLLLNEITATLAFEANIQKQHIDALLQWYRILDYVNEISKGADFDTELLDELNKAFYSAKLILDIQRAMLRLNMDMKHLNLIEMIEKINNIILDENIKISA